METGGRHRSRAGSVRGTANLVLWPPSRAEGNANAHIDAIKVKARDFC